jgi:UDP-N-acetylglucosamine 3-dehydrogenase
VNRLRVGVIGAGVMGERHARIYASLPDVELVAVCDTRADIARALAKDLDATPYADFAELLRHPDVDAVSVCTPDDAHRAPCEAAAAAGKHVLVEKPLAMTVADAEAIITAATKTGVVLLVGHCLRFDPRYRTEKCALGY